MKKSSKILALLASFVLVLCFALTGCGNDGDKSTSANNSESPNTGAQQLTYAEGTTLRMATGYNNPNTGIAFDAETVSGSDAKDGAEDGAITLPDGKNYKSGDLKPTWVEVEKRLGMKFESLWTGAGSAEKEFNVWVDKLEEVDMVSGSAAKLQEAGAQGKVIDISKHLDKMPNFKAYLDANPIVRLSITGSVLGDSKGAIYYSPYFDGVNDIERMPLMRTDWVTKLLDGDTAFAAETSKAVDTSAYTPYMPTTGTVEVDVVKADGSATEKLVKDYSKYGNIIAKMNAEASLTGVQAVAMLRAYIDQTYGNYYGNKRSDLFIGQNAAWDADELVALLRCVVANSQTLNGTETVAGFFTREDGNTQRRVDLFRFAGTLFGVRGLESRQDYLYFDKDGKLHDARAEAATYVAMEKFNAMATEGLIAADFLSKGSGTSATYLQKDEGFMSYDYNQTQTIMNDTKLNAKGKEAIETGEEYRAAMVPVAIWNDGEGTKYMRFTESWRSVKTDGWAISVAGVGENTDKLNACLKLIDYAYSEAGQILMSYGPDAFIDVKDANVNVESAADIAKKYNTFNFNGKQMPKISAETRESLTTLAGGNYTNYARFYLGSTLSFVKSQAFEIECTNAVGKLGAGYISNAIGFGTIKHPELKVMTNMWYTSIPTTLPTSTSENSTLSEYSQLSSNGKFSQSKGQTNILCDFVKDGYAVFAANEMAADATDATKAAAAVATEWKSNLYLSIKQDACTRLLDYFNK